MDSPCKNEGRINKRNEDSKGETLGERLGAEKSVIITVKGGRVRKPRRGNRAGAGRRRNGKNISEIGGLKTHHEPEKQRSDESDKIIAEGGKDAERRNHKKMERNMLKEIPGNVKDGSKDGLLQDSEALVKSKESKPRKTRLISTTRIALPQVESSIDRGDQETEASKHGSRTATFLDKMRARLSGGQFRMLNESLYTCKGDEAFELFQQDPGAFDLYHTGYREQMSRWPVLPVTVVTKWLKSRSPNLVVADFGCGDARLAKNVKNKVFSLDLVSSDISVIACNMAKTPLETSSVDVAVFCLSLMGTDYPAFLEEAHRVLRSKGWLLIAEVKSRLDEGNGGAGPQAFISAMRSLGFVLDSQDESNKMFHMFYFQKEGPKQKAKRKISWPEMKPCMYKRR